MRGSANAVEARTCGTRHVNVRADVYCVGLRCAARRREICLLKKGYETDLGATHREIEKANYLAAYRSTWWTLEILFDLYG